MPRDNVDELDAFADFPTEHWRKIWSANGLYRVIREIKAASMSSVSSQRTALLRLTGAVLAEIHDECKLANAAAYRSVAIRRPRR